MRTTPATPGPWHYEMNIRDNVLVYATRNGDDDKIIIGMSQFGPLEQREANARLIAAAPDLYEALQSMVREHGGHCLYARKALAKARGEQVSA